MKPQFKHEEIYLDLSKLSEEQQRKVIALLPEPINKDDYDIIYMHFYLIYDDEDCMWWVSTKYFLAEKTELTYSQFLDMMGETSADISILESTSKNEEVLQVENDGWIEVRNQLPICTSTGNWDGKQSDIILAETMTGKKFLAQCYEGFMDGSAFYDWYQVDEINSNDWLINESVSRWMKIPF